MFLVVFSASAASEVVSKGTVLFHYVINDLLSNTIRILIKECEIINTFQYFSNIRRLLYYDI